jgi:hypothetical protein
MSEPRYRRPHLGTYIYEPAPTSGLGKSISYNPRFQPKGYYILVPHLPELVPRSPYPACRFDLVPDVRFPVLDANPEVLRGRGWLGCAPCRFVAFANGLFLDQLYRRISPAGLWIRLVAHTDQSITILFRQALGPLLSRPQRCVSAHGEPLLGWIKIRPAVTRGFSPPSALCS